MMPEGTSSSRQQPQNDAARSNTRRRRQRRPALLRIIFPNSSLVLVLLLLIIPISLLSAGFPSVFFAFADDAGDEDSGVFNDTASDDDSSSLHNDTRSDVTRSDNATATATVIMTEEEPLTESDEDEIEDGIFDPYNRDPSCETTVEEECWKPPASTVEYQDVDEDEDEDENDGENDDKEEGLDFRAFHGGSDPDEDPTTPTEPEQQQSQTPKNEKKKKARVRRVDKHWGSDESILKMRDALRDSDDKQRKRPPVFLMPGLAATRLVAWRPKICPNVMVSNIAMQDYVWLNVQKVLEMATLDFNCWVECMTLGLNQTDLPGGCKLRPDEGLDAISSLAPSSFSSEKLVGGTNTVYAWLTQWLADNLGYDVGSIVGLPYDWRLSPDIMEKRDGFLTLTKKRMEAAVMTNGGLPGVMVAHSMGNPVFRYFLEWLRTDIRREIFQNYLENTEHRKSSIVQPFMSGWMGGLPHSGMLDIDKLERFVGSPSVDDDNDEMTEDKGKKLKDFVSNVDEWIKSRLSKLKNEEQKTATEEESSASYQKDSSSQKQGNAQERLLWELASIEGDAAWLKWIEKHIWAYVGLSAPLLGAVNPLRAVLSGENMGLPVKDSVARAMELTYGSTHVVNPISTKLGFCDQENDRVKSVEVTPDGNISSTSSADESAHYRPNLACLDEILHTIEEQSSSKEGREDPWRNFPALRKLLKERIDWDSSYSPITVIIPQDSDEEQQPNNQTSHQFSSHDVQSGHIFDAFAGIWEEEGDPLLVKREQLENSWWKNDDVPNILNFTWDRPHIKHVIMAYGVDVPTEAGYVYRKQKREAGKKYDGIPSLHQIIREEANGKLVEEDTNHPRGGVIRKKKPKIRSLKGTDGKGALDHSGDGTVPYLSLMWAHTWLLHATRAMRHSNIPLKSGNPLELIEVSHRPKGEMDWIKGGIPSSCPEGGQNGEDKKGDMADTGTSHPHGTKYKPGMVRFRSKGRSRTTGMEYTTTVIEAIGVEHKETTRNYDILAAVFSDVLKEMHDDFAWK